MAPENGDAFVDCLTHDVDRAYNTYQYIYNCVAKRDPSELTDLLRFENPYWQFERYIAIESAYDVRSSFNILDEMSLRERPEREWSSQRGREHPIEPGHCRRRLPDRTTSKRRAIIWD